MTALRAILATIAIALFAALPAFADPVDGFIVRDKPGDAGGTILAEWKAAPGDPKLLEYAVFTGPSKDGPWEEAERFPGTAHLQSLAPELYGRGKEAELKYFFPLEGFLPGEKELQLGEGHSLETWVKVQVVVDGKPVDTAPLSARAAPNWWAPAKTNIFVFLLLFGGATFGLIASARKNPDVFIRRIPGLDAMEEAIGRATEMGRPIIYLNGLNGMDSISTIASVSILGQVARRVATYDSQILVPCYDAVVLSISQEVMREGYTAAGRPDKYRPQDAWFITNEQFSYVASVDGLMLREKPAACLYMGYYYAESLLLAETGGSTGAIQIAGTDSVTQLPFFIACCDYTLIGEELYAASAYLSREPLQLGSLRSQDLGKVFIIATIVAGAVAAAAQFDFLRHMLGVN